MKDLIEINLAEAPAETELLVLEINAGHFTRKRLIAMGIHVGDKLTKYGHASWGPVLVKNITLQASKIAIGRRLASKIMVAYEKA